MGLIERLINKDYLTERERKEWLGTIKERLEALEKEKEYLKTTNEALNEMLLQASNEAIELETENEQLKDSIQIKQKQVNECIDSLTQEIEKLKKEIKQLKDNEALVEMYLNTSDETVKSQQKVWQLKNAIKNILEYAKCELDNIEIVDRIENILMEVGYYE